MIVSDRDLETRAAVDGVGIVCTVAERVSEHVAGGRLVPILERWAGPFPGYFLCYPRQRHMVPALRVFIDCLVGDRSSLGSRSWSTG